MKPLVEFVRIWIRSRREDGKAIIDPEFKPLKWLLRVIPNITCFKRISRSTNVACFKDISQDHILNTFEPDMMAVAAPGDPGIVYGEAEGLEKSGYRGDTRGMIEVKREDARDAINTGNATMPVHTS